MKIIKVRSPYIISVNEEGQTAGKIEIRIWKPNATKPTDATYVLSKAIPSSTQLEVTFNISPFVKDFIENKIENAVTNPTLVSYNYANVEVKSFYTTNGTEWTLIETIEYIATNGYTNFVSGVNADLDLNSFIDLTGYFLNVQKSIVLYYDRSRYDEYFFTFNIPNGNIYKFSYVYFNTPISSQVSEGGIYKVPITTNASAFNNGNFINIDLYDDENEEWIEVASIFVKPICETIMTPTICTFINRYGAIQQLTFFKMRTDSIDVTSDKYNLMPSSWDYDPTQGIYRQHNFNGKQSIKLNTGFVPEDYNVMMQDLILSESVWLDGIPATVKTQSLEMKTQVRNKNINYEVDFEYGFDIINSVV